MIFICTENLSDNLLHQKLKELTDWMMLNLFDFEICLTIDKHKINKYDMVISSNSDNFLNAEYKGIIISDDVNINIDEADKKYCNGDCFRVNNWSEIPTYIKFISYCINEEINGEL